MQSSVDPISCRRPRQQFHQVKLLIYQLLHVPKKQVVILPASSVFKVWQSTRASEGLHECKSLSVRVSLDKRNILFASSTATVSRIGMHFDSYFDQLEASIQRI